MNSSIEVLRSEVKRLRSLAERMEAFIFELEGKPPQVAVTYSPATFNGGPSRQEEFAGLTQHAAILKALEYYGPQTTRQLFDRLNAGGMSFKKPVYVTAILGRLKEVVERTEDNKIRLRNQVAHGVGTGE